MSNENQQKSKPTLLTEDLPGGLSHESFEHAGRNTNPPPKPPAPKPEEQKEEDKD